MKATNLYSIYPMLTMYPFIQLDRFKTKNKNTGEEEISYSITLSAESLYNKPQKEKETIPMIVYSGYVPTTKIFINSNFKNIDSKELDLRMSKNLKSFIETFLAHYVFVSVDTEVRKSDSFNLVNYLIMKIKHLVEEGLIC